MPGPHPIGHCPFKRWHYRPLSEVGAAEHLCNRGDVGFGNAVAAVGEERQGGGAHMGSKAGSTCSRISARSWCTLRKSGLLPEL